MKGLFFVLGLIVILMCGVCKADLRVDPQPDDLRVTGYYVMFNNDGSFNAIIAYGDLLYQGSIVKSGDKNVTNMTTLNDRDKMFTFKNMLEVGLKGEVGLSQ